MNVIDPLRIDHGQRMRLRKCALYHVFENEDRLTLAVDGRAVEPPTEAGKIINFIENSNEFTPDLLPGVEHNTKLILAKTLLDCRFFELLQ